jgi:hypothetical protein
LSIRIPDGFFNDPNRKDENWLTFKKNYTTYCDLQQLDDSQAKGVLFCAMRGAAAEAVVNIDISGYTALGLLEAFEKKFLPAASSALAQTTFEQAVMKAGESTLSWHSRLFSTWKRAYPNMTDETLLIRRFALGLVAVETRRELLRQKPKTYDEALEIAQTEEAVYKATKSTAINQAIMPATGVEEPMDINAMGSKVKCYRCQQEGHIQKDCPRPAPKAGQGSGAGSGKGKPFFKKNRNAQPRGRQERRRRFKQRMISAIGEALDGISEEESGTGDSGEDTDAEEDQSAGPSDHTAKAVGN